MNKIFACCVLLSPYLTLNTGDNYHLLEQSEQSVYMGFIWALQ
jgi:hypothetical protein